MIIIIESFISDWLKDILVLFIVISFLEIILPKGKMKKFVNFIIGLLIIFVIISPFTALDQFKHDIDMEVDDFMNRRGTQELLSDQENRIKQVFTTSLMEEVKDYIQSNSNYEVVDININTIEEEGIMIIQEVSLIIRSIDENENKNEKIIIDKIQIVDNHEPIDIDENNHEEIQNLISDYLDIDKNIVYISETD